MDHAEAGKEIRRAVDTGKVVFGTKESLSALREGEGQLLVLTKNAPVLNIEEMIHMAALAEIPVYRFNGNGLELGSVCGKPYVISTLLIMAEGKSKVLQLGQKNVEMSTESVAEKPKRGRKKKTME